MVGILNGYGQANMDAGIKRSAPFEFSTDDRPTKRTRTINHGVRHQQLHTAEALAGAQDSEFFQSQLLRAISLALSAVGFTGATAEALEAFRADVEEYITRFTFLISTSMLSSRRARPIPQDFTIALAATGFRSSQLEPHIALNPPPSITQPVLELQAPEPLPPPSLEVILGPSLSGAAEKGGRLFIPKHFPNLPSRHTWQKTPSYSTRETDPRKIRERATAEGVLAEQALRKLMAARFESRGRLRTIGSVRGMQSESVRKNQEVWEETWRAAQQADEEALQRFEMENPDWYGTRDRSWALTANGESNHSGNPDPVGLPDGMVVNYERKYWRQGAKNQS